MTTEMAGATLTPPPPAAGGAVGVVTESDSASIVTSPPPAVSVAPAASTAVVSRFRMLIEIDPATPTSAPPAPLLVGAPAPPPRPPRGPPAAGGGAPPAPPRRAVRIRRARQGERTGRDDGDRADERARDRLVDVDADRGGDAHATLAPLRFGRCLGAAPTPATVGPRELVGERALLGGLPVRAVVGGG